YGFNASGFKRVSFRWQGFSLFGYTHLFNRPDLTAALKNSLVIAVVSTIIATILGTLIALALVRYRFRGRAVSDFVMFLNLAAPEIVLGASLLALFVSFGVPRGILTTSLARGMCTMADVPSTVRARRPGA